MRKIIVMIPARLGSKRIPKKNIRYLLDKPLIQYPIDLVKDLEGIDSVWVTTESAELGKAVETMGARFHQRPAELSSDTQTNRGFTYDFMMNHDCDYVMMVNTTSPTLRQETVKRFIEFINETDADTVLSVVSEKAESFFRGRPLNFDLHKKVNSQMLEPIDKTVWALTAWKRSTFLRNEENGIEPIFGGKVTTFAIPKDESCDLDTDEDWRVAEGTLLSRQTSGETRYLPLEK